MTAFGGFGQVGKRKGTDSIRAFVVPRDAPPSAAGQISHPTP
jgi:hypothetical protein